LGGGTGGAAPQGPAQAPRQRRRHGLPDPRGGRPDDAAGPPRDVTPTPARRTPGVLPRESSCPGSRAPGLRDFGYRALGVSALGFRDLLPDAAGAGATG